MSRKNAPAECRNSTTRPSPRCSPCSSRRFSARSFRRSTGQSLGETSQVRASRLWVRTTVWLIIAFLIAQVLLRNEPLMKYAGIYFLIVLWVCWMATTGWRQIRYVKDMTVPWKRKRFGRAILIGGGGWVLYSLASLTVAMALTMLGIEPVSPLPPEQQNGVIVRMPKGSNKAVIEPIPPERRTQGKDIPAAPQH
ncbi:MAG: hypothetical protein ACFWTZ_06865 [Burkholderia sp.]|jgi:hypothetical protein